MWKNQSLIVTTAVMNRTDNVIRPRSLLLWVRTNSASKVGKSPRFWTRVFPDGVSTEISETNRESVALYLRGAIIGTK